MSACGRRRTRLGDGDTVAAALRPLARCAGLGGSRPFTLGEPGDLRVPDRGLHRGRSEDVGVTAALTAGGIDWP